VSLNQRNRQIKDQILQISSGARLQPFTTNFSADPDLSLDIIAEKIIRPDKVNPIVLFNLLPWNKFNLIHAIFCQKLADYTRMGFDCVILLYDKEIERSVEISNQDRVSLQRSVRNCINRFLRAGLIEEKTEFITESDLWKMLKAEEFVDTITSLAFVCEIDNKWKKRRNIVSFVLSNLCEIYYENVINCDIVLTGHMQAQSIWGMLRHKQKNILSNYNPPLILACPTLIGIDDKPLSTSNDENSISIHHDTRELRKRLSNCPQHFIETIFNYLLLSWKKSFSAFDRTFYSYKEMTERLTEEQIRNLAFDLMNEYFIPLK
jgi:hypothetical protein